MPKIVQVKVDVESGGVEVAVDRTETLIRQIRDLKYTQQQLDTATKEGAAAYAELNVKILELNEQLEVNKVRNKSLFDQIGMLGGEFGETGAKIGETVTSLRILSAFRFEDLKSGLAFVGSTLGSIAKGFGEVTGITKVYTVLNEALAASFVEVGVAEETAAVGAQLFSSALVATGIGVVVVALGYAVSALKEFFSSEEKSTEAINEFNNALEYQKHLLEVDTTALDAANKAAVTRAKIAGASEKEIREIEQKGYEEKLELLRQNDEKINEKRSELAKNTVISAKERIKLQKELDKEYQESNAAITKLITENEQKSLDERLKNADKARAASKAANDKYKQEIKQLTDEINKAETEGYLATLSKQEQEEYKTNQHYAELLAKATKFGLDTEGIEKARLNAINKIQADYRSKAIDDFEKKLKEDLDK